MSFFYIKSPESSNIDLGMKVFYDLKLFIALFGNISLE